MPLLAFTTQKGLLLDFDCFDMYRITQIAEGVTRKYSCGDLLIMQSPWRGYMTLDGMKAFHAHAIFGAVMPHSKVQRILTRLRTLHIVEELFRYFHQVERELTLRTVPKRIGERPPMPFGYIIIDGQNEVICDYIEQWKMDNKIFREVVCPETAPARGCLQRRASECSLSQRGQAMKRIVRRDCEKIGGGR